MIHRPSPLPFAGLATVAVLTALLAALALAPATVAHGGTTVGDYVIEVGWRDEPPSIGRLNAVQVTVEGRDDLQPVIDLGAGSLTVVVSIAGSDSPRLSLVPAFDPAASGGPLGIYQAEFVLTVPGKSTFHLTGSIHGTAVDVTIEGVVVEASAPVDEEPEPGLDPVLLLGGTALLALLGATAFLLFRVRQAPVSRSERRRPGR